MLEILGFALDLKLGLGLDAALLLDVVDLCPNLLPPFELYVTRPPSRPYLRETANSRPACACLY